MIEAAINKPSQICWPSLTPVSQQHVSRGNQLFNAEPERESDLQILSELALTRSHVLKDYIQDGVQGLWRKVVAHHWVFCVQLLMVWVLQSGQGTL